MTDDAGPSGDASPAPGARGDETRPDGPLPAAEDPKPVAEPPDPADGPLLEYEEGEALEAHDRQHSGPGGEPACPRCGTQMVRMVEQHRAPRSDDSPFRIRLVCGSTECAAWTTYNW